VERQIFLHSKFSEFSRAARRTLQPLPCIGQAASASPAPDAHDDEKARRGGEGCQLQGYLIGRQVPIAHDRHMGASVAEACGSFVVIR
jgi:hypothetical protein